MARAARGHHVKEFAFGGGEPASLDAHQIGAGRDAVKCEVTGPIRLSQQEIAPLRGDGGADDRTRPVVGDVAFDPTGSQRRRLRNRRSGRGADAETVGITSSGPIVLVRAL